MTSKNETKDGGGVRGLSSLLILQELMESVRKSQGLEVAPLPCEYFDMIAGTSTGGLIAILLGRLRMSVSDCIDLYKKFGQEIFEKELGWTTSTRFSSAVLQSVLEKIITNHIGHEEAFLRDPMVADGGGCPVFVVAIDRERIAEPEGAVLLRTYDREDLNQPLNLKYCFLWQAALATCAAPIFFSPVQVGSQFLVDGGLGHNNPTEHLIEEAELQWPERPISAVVSIGTGLKKSSELAKDLTKAASGSRFRSMYHMALVLKHIALSSEHIERSVRSLFKGRHNLDSYFRFNVSEGMDIELYEYQKYPQIQQSTRSYLDQKEVQDRMQVCAETLECIIAGEKRQSNSGSGVYEKLAPSPLTPLPSSEHMDLTESFRESLALKGQQRNLEQTWQFLEDPAIELYVRDHLITDECVTVLAYDSKLPERLHLSTAQLPDDRRNHPANPKGYLAYFLSSKLPKSFTAEQRRLSILNLQMSEEACRIDMSPGAWQLSWLVLIDRRRIVSHSPDEGGILDAERNIINSMAIDDKEEANSQSSCGPLVTFSAESLNNDQEIHRVALEVEMILGVDIAEGPFWQEIVLDEFMVVQAQKPVLQFVVTCKDRTWFEEEKRDEWIIYVGGVRYTQTFSTAFTMLNRY
ncbi:hypothetical protein MMC22_009860 [Lobaria immixta]|nr:hypothetical protein [Lobaria immixta]